MFPGSPESSCATTASSSSGPIGFLSNRGPAGPGSRHLRQPPRPRGRASRPPPERDLKPGGRTGLAAPVNRGVLGSNRPARQASQALCPAVRIQYLTPPPRTNLRRRWADLPSEWPAPLEILPAASPDNSRTPSRNTRKSLRDKAYLVPDWIAAAVHLVPARDFSSGRGRPTTAMPGASQRRSDDVSGGKDPRDGWSRS